eukprot:3007286-Pleurochrysis_carterae.AAC.3
MRVDETALSTGSRTKTMNLNCDFGAKAAARSRGASRKFINVLMEGSTVSAWEEISADRGHAWLTKR